SVEILIDIACSILQKISSAVVEIKDTNKSILERLATIDTHLTETDNCLAAAESQISKLSREVANLRTHLNDQENHARRNNLRILGFPEGIEQGNPSRFLEEALLSLLGFPEGTKLKIERAHRSLGPKPAAGQRPHPFIVKFLWFPMKEKILRTAREKGVLDWEGQRILIFPDLSRDLQERRRQFLKVKQMLWDKKIKYGLYYPAILKITCNGVTTSYTSAEAAEKFVLGLQ
uniref:L1 transposable element RRM domain-containing protein n=1 Tax=Latimeria chalumnae TaxID=7897 RepID=H3ART6_LATCH